MPLEVFSQRCFVVDFIQLNLTFIPKKGKVRFLSHPLGDLTCALHLWLVGKPVYDFLFVIIELFSLTLTVDTLQAEISRRERFLERGVSLRSPTLGRRGRRPPTSVGWQKTRGIALSCGTQNIARRFFGLVTKDAYDRRTDRITTPKTALA